MVFVGAAGHGVRGAGRQWIWLVTCEWLGPVKQGWFLSQLINHPPHVQMHAHAQVAVFVSDACEPVVLRKQKTVACRPPSLRAQLS